MADRTRPARVRPTIRSPRPRRTLSQRFVEIFPIVAPWLVLAAVIAFLWPVQFGGVTSFSIVSGKSMERTYHTGDLVITKVRPAYKIGEIVVYKIPGTDTGHGREVVHRLHSRLPDGKLLAQGDNNTTVDPWTITDADIVGAKWLMIPKAGVFLGFLRSPAAVAILIGALVMWVAWPQRDEDDPDVTAVTAVTTVTTVTADVDDVDDTAVVAHVAHVAEVPDSPAGVAPWHWLDDDGIPDASGPSRPPSPPVAPQTIELVRDVDSTRAGEVAGEMDEIDDWLADARIEAEFWQSRNVRPAAQTPPLESEQSALWLRPAPEPASR